MEKKKVTFGLKIRQQTGSGPEAVAITFIFRKKNNRIFHVGNGFCLANLKHSTEKHKANWIDLISNTKKSASTGHYGYLSPKRVSAYDRKGELIKVPWKKEYTNKVIDILSRSNRWGKYFTIDHPEGVLKKLRGQYILRVNPKEISYAMTLFLFGWYRYLAESRSYGYSLIKWYEWNQKKDPGEQLTVDQLVVISNYYRFYTPDPNVLKMNQDSGPGHRNFNGYFMKDLLGRYDKASKEMYNHTPLCCATSKHKTPAEYLNIGPPYQNCYTLDELLTYLEDK